MKTRRSGEVFLAALFFGYFAVLVGISLTYSPKARRMPLVVMVPGLALAGANLMKAAAERRAAPPPPVEAAGAEAEGGESSGEPQRLFLMIGWVLLLVLMIWIAGFLITIPVYTLLFMRVMKESWRLSILFAVSGFAVLYLLFGVTLHIELYPGLLFLP